MFLNASLNFLECCLKVWQDGDIDGLMRGGRTLQHPPPLIRRSKDEEGRSRIFAKLVMEGKIHSAVRFLSENQGGGVLDLNEFVDDSRTRTVLDVLSEKHPPGQDMAIDALVTTSEEPPETHPILFERLTGSLIRACALRSRAELDHPEWTQRDGGVY